MANLRNGPVLTASSRRYCRYGQLTSLDAIALRGARRPKHIETTCRPDDRDEAVFESNDGEDWQPVIISTLQHLSVWAQTADRRLWFVTNGRRIRLRTPEDADP